MQEIFEQTLMSRGYRHYETSAYAQPGKESQHNTNYWLFGDYLGIGAGAHSKISFSDKIESQMRFKQPGQYLEQASSASRGQIYSLLPLTTRPPFQPERGF